MRESAPAVPPYSQSVSNPARSYFHPQIESLEEVRRIPEV